VSAVAARFSPSLFSRVESLVFFAIDGAPSVRVKPLPIGLAPVPSFLSFLLCLPRSNRRPQARDDIVPAALLRSRCRRGLLFLLGTAISPSRDSPPLPGIDVGVRREDRRVVAFRWGEREGKGFFPPRWGGREVIGKSEWRFLFWLYVGRYWWGGIEWRGRFPPPRGKRIDFRG